MARRSPKSRGRSLAGIAVRLAAVLLTAWAAGFAWFVLTLAPPAPEGTKTQGVVVLTGGPGRVARGVAVLQAGLAERLLISGVDKVARPGEIREAADIPPALFDCCVELGFVADDTRSNAAEVAAWVAHHRLRRIRLVTAHYHMPRAHAEIGARLPPSVTIVADGVPAPFPAWRMAIEYSKYLVARTLLLVRRKRY